MWCISKLNQRSLEYKQLELTTQQEVWFKCKPSLRLKSPGALSALLSMWARLKRQTPIRVMIDMNHQNPRIFPYFQFSCSIAVDKVRKQVSFFSFAFVVCGLPNCNLLLPVQFSSKHLDISLIAPAGLSPRGESSRRPSLKVAPIYTECTYSQNIQFVYQINFDSLKQGPHGIAW